MISKTFAVINEYTEPVFLPRGKSLVISLSGTFVGEVGVQRCVKPAGDLSFPGPSDAGWVTVNSFTAPEESGVDIGDSCWYRALCVAYSSGSPVVLLKLN